MRRAPPARRGRAVHPATLNAAPPRRPRLERIKRHPLTLVSFPSLSQGKLGQLAQLAGAMSFLPAGLCGLMQSYRDSFAGPQAKASAAAGAAAAAWWAAGGEALPGAGEVVAAVVEAVAELPVWESPAVEEVGGRGRGQQGPGWG